MPTKKRKENLSRTLIILLGILLACLLSLNIRSQTSEVNSPIDLNFKLEIPTQFQKSVGIFFMNLTEKRSSLTTDR